MSRVSAAVSSRRRLLSGALNPAISRSAGMPCAAKLAWSELAISGRCVAIGRPARADEPGIRALSPQQAVRVLGPEEINLLTKQGEQFVEAGDFVTARTLFQRAAEANDATAATALGATYDPTVLARLGAVGVDPDLVKARFWYQKAVSLGSSDAKRRLDLLANR